MCNHVYLLKIIICQTNKIPLKKPIQTLKQMIKTWVNAVEYSIYFIALGLKHGFMDTHVIQMFASMKRDYGCGDGTHKTDTNIEDGFIWCYRLKTVH